MSVKSKAFKSVKSLVGWADREIGSISILGTLREGTEFHLIYEDNREAVVGIKEDRLARAKVAIKRHIEYPETTKTKLGYPKQLIGFKVAPWSKVLNSLRNLKPFEGVSYADISSCLSEACREAGYRVLVAESKAEYGVDMALIEDS